MTELLKFQDAVNDLLIQKTDALTEKHFVLVILNQEVLNILRKIDVKYHHLLDTFRQLEKSITDHLLNQALHPYMSKRRLRRLIQDPEAFIYRWKHLDFDSLLSQYFQPTTSNVATPKLAFS